MGARGKRRRYWRRRFLNGVLRLGCIVVTFQISTQASSLLLPFLDKKREGEKNEKDQENKRVHLGSQQSTTYATSQARKPKGRRQRDMGRSQPRHETEVALPKTRAKTRNTVKIGANGMSTFQDSYYYSSSSSCYK